MQRETQQQTSYSSRDANRELFLFLFLGPKKAHSSDAQASKQMLCAHFACVCVSAARKRSSNRQQKQSHSSFSATLLLIFLFPPQLKIRSAALGGRGGAPTLSPSAFIGCRAAFQPALPPWLPNAEDEKRGKVRQWQTRGQPGDGVTECQTNRGDPFQTGSCSLKGGGGALQQAETVQGVFQENTHTRAEMQTTQ